LALGAALFFFGGLAVLVGLEWSKGWFGTDSTDPAAAIPGAIVALCGLVIFVIGWRAN
jgi:drug/metabolite transporter superfamily protein YnfA